MPDLPLKQTQHSLQRLAERTRLTPDDVRDLVARDHFVPLGSDGHRDLGYLIYSAADQDFLILVVTPDRTRIKTVLTDSMADTSSWKLRINNRIRAKAARRAHAHASLIAGLLADASGNCRARVCLVAQLGNGHYHYANLSAVDVPAGWFVHDPIPLPADETGRRIVETALAGISTSERTVVAVSLRIGKFLHVEVDPAPFGLQDAYTRMASLRWKDPELMAVMP